MRTALRWLMMLLILVSAAVCMADEAEIIFHHKTSGDIKARCKNFQGKHDQLPRYKCWDITAHEWKDFDPKSDWEKTEWKPFCLKHKIRATIRINCREIKGKETHDEIWGCYDEKKENLTVMTLAEYEKKYEKMDWNGTDCKALRNQPGTKDDVPRGSSEKSKQKEK